MIICGSIVEYLPFTIFPEEGSLCPNLILIIVGCKFLHQNSPLIIIDCLGCLNLNKTRQLSKMLRTSGSRFYALLQSGPNGELSQKVINEVIQAKILLLDQERKFAYDEELRAKQIHFTNRELPPLKNRKTSGYRP